MTLLLDPDIRDWVVLPLFVIMVAAGLLRQSVGQLLQSPKQKTPVLAQRAQNVLQQCSRIRSGAAHYMTTSKWHVRKQHAVKVLQEEATWCEEQAAAAEENGEAEDPMGAMMNNPLSMMKGNMAFMVQNMVMMQGIQHFFSGFILLKVPFSLTVGFKNMFQRGLAEQMPDLESSYVSSVSWYFLVMYGLRSFFKIVIGEPPLEIREQEMAARQKHGMQNQQPPGKSQDGEAMAKMLRQEAENLELILQQHKSEFDNVEKRLLGKRYPKKTTISKSKEDDFLFGGDTAKKGKKSKKKSN